MIYINHHDVLDGKVIIVEVKGPLNSETSLDFEEYINRLLARNSIFIILNALSIDYVSSEGIGVILFMQKKISEKNGFFVIYDLNNEIRQLFLLLGFDKIVWTVGSRIEAMEVIDRQLEMRESPGGKTEAGEMPPVLADIEKPEKDNDNLPDEIQEKVAFAPFIIECARCKSLIRVRESGEYLCPDCNASFTVNHDMTVHF